MSWSTLGTMALPYALQRNGVQARTDLARNSQELTTGQVQSVARHLRGDIAALHAIENRLSRIGTYELSIKQTTTAFDSAQSALDQVAKNGMSLAEKLVLTAQGSAGPSARTVSADAARSVIEETVSALSLSVAGRGVFSGVEVARAPLAPLNELLAALGPVVAGLTTEAELTAALETYFMSPGNGFLDDIYRGGHQAEGGMIDDGTPASALPTAADPAIRRQLMSAAMVVLIDSGAIEMNATEERKVLGQALTALLENAGGMAAMQARVGIAQEVLDQRMLRLSLERDRLEIMRSDKIGVDPYKAAMAVEQSRVQLESIYAMTARLTRLSLTEYLR